MNDEQRTLLNLFNDGEADPSQSLNARQLIDTDAEAKVYWQALQRTDDRLREAFGPVAGQAIPSRFEQPEPDRTLGEA